MMGNGFKFSKFKNQKTTRMQLNNLLLLILFSFLATSCVNPKKTPSDTLGNISFQVTGKEEVQPIFKKGMLLLHSFEYADAAEAFQQVKKIDPAFVMAYWGEAMTLNHPLWQEQDYDRGVALLNQLAPTAAERRTLAKTTLEKDLISGINILYGKGNKAERDSIYATYMETLYKKYPGNDEVAAFYSLSLNGWGTTEQDMSILQKAADIGNEILQRNPNHPGALHYIIHALDNPDYAEKALAVADKYALVAKDAGHALHMPTHIYLALGLWEKLINSNEISWAAEMNRRDRKKLNNDALGYHAYHWLQYGYLQNGNKEKARNMLDSVKKYCSTLPSPKARNHVFYLKTTYLAETNDYSKEVVAISFENKDLNILTRARNNFVTGMNAFYQKDETAIEEVITKMAGDRLIEQSKAADKGIRICGNINRAIATKNDLLESEAMELQLKAMKTWLRKDAAATEKLLQQATALQQKVGFSYGPPAIVKPTYEMYGEWLLETGQPKLALEQFELSLKLAPNRLLSLKGKEKAREQLRI